MRIHRALALLLTITALAACQTDASRSPTLSVPPASVGLSASAPASAGPEASFTLDPLPSGPDALALEPFAGGLSEPIGLTNAGDGSGLLYVNERSGRVRVVESDGSVRGDPFVDLSAVVVAGGEQGLLGLAFHPDYAQNRRLFVTYTAAADGADTLAELSASADGTRVDPASLRVLFAVPDPAGNHNGGQLAFGPDGYLYVALGDGGGANDQFGNGQDPGTLLGTILRLDVDSAPAPGAAYAVPSDNPFAADGAHAGQGAPEIWAWGLRNPWRFSFDPESGDLYIADVGQRAWEEINRQPGDSAGGENYGWSMMEGRHCFGSETCDQSPFVAPIAEYSHDQGCSVTGGYVYRGAAQPALDGIYVFGDHCSGLIFTLHVDEGTITPKLVLESGRQVSSFGVDEGGEIYLVSLGDGALYRVVVP
ncbi:MAG: PQQ-dependent sugar dehydrogenase [Chloroflexota bacterium]